MEFLYGDIGRGGAVERYRRVCVTLIGVFRQGDIEGVGSRLSVDTKARSDDSAG
jgi:hypothetical protein